MDIVLTWRNSDKIRSMMYNDNIIKYEEHLSWYQSLKTSETTRVKVLLYLNEPMGLVQFNQINKTDNKCYWGFYIGDPNAPKGAGTILGYLALRYVFEEQKIRKVCSEIIAYNTQSINFHKKMGFIEEGRLKKHIYRNNKFIDVILMSQFNCHWEELKVEFEEKFRR